MAIRKRPLTAGALAVGFLVAGCGSTDSDPEGSFDASLDCNGLADRWVEIQQEYLDRLGDASTQDLSDAVPAVAAASRWVGNALIEQARDAQAVGCDAELTAGSDKLCARVDQLEAHGPAGAVVLSGLSSTCS